jgi:hypothetical protein
MRRNRYRPGTRGSPMPVSGDFERWYQPTLRPLQHLETSVMR